VRCAATGLVAIGLVLIAALLAVPATAGAQEPGPCPADKTMDARVEVEDADNESHSLVATHEVFLTADVADRISPVSSPPDHVSITPQAGVEVLQTSSGGSTIRVFAPATGDLTVTVSWRQTVDPGDSDETAKCSASRTLTLPVLAAAPARGAKQPNPGPATGFYTFAIAVAGKRPDRRPLEVSVRSTAHARYPRAKERLRNWAIPLRGAEKLRYHTRLPNLAYATTAQKCRSWWMTCGPTFAYVAELNSNSRGTGPDLSGSNAILRSLAFSQPARWAVSWGIVITATPGAKRPNAWGYDVQVRQGGRLLARVRRAGRCRLEHRSYGIFDNCKLSRSSTLLR
jgi:hypothetical protein